MKFVEPLTYKWAPPFYGTLWKWVHRYFYPRKKISDYEHKNNAKIEKHCWLCSILYIIRLEWVIQEFILFLASLPPVCLIPLIILALTPWIPFQSWQQSIGTREHHYWISPGRQWQILTFPGVDLGLSHALQYSICEKLTFRLAIMLYSVTQLSLTLCNPRVAAHQSPLSMEFSRQEYWSGFLIPLPVNLPHPGIKHASLACPALAGEFFTTASPGNPCCHSIV